MWCFCFRVDTLCCYVPNMNVVQMNYSCFKIIEKDIIHINFRQLFGNSMVVIHTLCTNCISMCPTLTLTHDMVSSYFY